MSRNFVITSRLPTTDTAEAAARAARADENRPSKAPADDAVSSDDTSRLLTSVSDTLNTSLLVRVQAGDGDAWQKLVHLYTPLVYRLCRRCNVQQDDAEDIAQEVFRAVSRRVKDFEKQAKSHSFRGWLWTITRNKIRDHARARAGRKNAVGGTQIQQRLGEVPDIAAEVLDDDSHWTEEDEHSLLHGVLELIRDEFGENTWEAFWRSTVKGQSSAEIAQDLEMSKPAVRQAKYRILRRLRQEIGNLL